MHAKGTVVLVPFPFTDLSGDKVRPAIIVSKANLADDVVVAFITSQNERKVQPTDVSIKTTDTDFNLTGLKTNSIIRVQKLATLNKQVVLGELGTLPSVVVKKIDQKLKVLFGI